MKLMGKDHMGKDHMGKDHMGKDQASCMNDCSVTLMAQSSSNKGRRNAAKNRTERTQKQIKLSWLTGRDAETPMP